MLQPTTIDFKALAELQKDDQELQALQTSSTIPLKFSVTLHLSSQVTLISNTSTSNLCPFVPAKFRHTVFNAPHSLSHPGTQEMQHLISDCYVWPGMKEDVGAWTQAVPTNLNFPDTQ